MRAGPIFRDSEKSREREEPSPHLRTTAVLSFSSRQNPEPRPPPADSGSHPPRRGCATASSRGRVARLSLPSSRLQSRRVRRHWGPLHPAPGGARGRPGHDRARDGPAEAGSSAALSERAAGGGRGWVALRSASGRGRSRGGGQSRDYGRFRSGAGGSTSERGGHTLAWGAQK